MKANTKYGIPHIIKQGRRLGLLYLIICLVVYYSISMLQTTLIRRNNHNYGYIFPLFNGGKFLVFNKKAFTDNKIGRTMYNF